MFEINYSQLIQYEILEKLVTYMVCRSILGRNEDDDVLPSGWLGDDVLFAG